MARGIRKIDDSGLEFNEIEIEGEDISKLEGDLDGQLNSINAEFGSDENDVEIFMKVYRVGVSGAEYLFTMYPHELPILDRLRDEYGPGAYETRVYCNKKLKRKLMTKIGAPPKPNTSRPANSEITQLATIMMQGFEKQSQMIAELAKRQSNPVNVPQPMNMMEMLQGFGAIMQTMSSIMPKPTENNLETMFKFMQLGKELGSERGETNTSDILLAAINNLGPVLGKTLEGQARAEPRTHINAPNLTVKQNPTPRGEPQMLSPQMQIVKMQLKNLVKKAESNSDQELYADFILDNVPEDQLISLIFAEDVKQRLIALEPGVAAQWPWFEKLIDILKSAFVVDDIDDIDDTESNPVGSEVIASKSTKELDSENNTDAG